MIQRRERGGKSIIFSPNFSFPKKHLSLPPYIISRLLVTFTIEPKKKKTRKWENRRKSTRYIDTNYTRNQALRNSKFDYRGISIEFKVLRSVKFKLHQKKKKEEREKENINRKKIPRPRF